MTIREQTEKIERDTLSPFACLSEKTKGREEKAPLCDMRTEFQRDRDKIIHSKSFRRLKHFHYSRGGPLQNPSYPYA